MARVVRRHPDFEADYRELLRNLVARDEREWILILANGLEEVVQMLSAFPAAGPRIAERGTVLANDPQPAAPATAGQHERRLCCEPA